MNNLTKAFSYLIAAQVQALTLILGAWWIGDWLNTHHPISFSWYAVTIPVGLLAMTHSFYVVIRYTMKQQKKIDQKDAEKNDSGRGR